MHLDRKQSISNRQKGSMLITALFVIIVLSLLGLAMTRLLSASSDAVTHEIYGIRALNAAQSGLQIILADSFPIDGSTPVCDIDADPDVDDGEEYSFTQSFAGVPGLENCSAQVRCTNITFDDDNIEYYRFESTGTCTIGDIVTTRSVAVDGKVETDA